MIFECHENLGQNFPGRDIAHESELCRQAEVAIHCASRLRRNTNRLAAIRGHEDSFYTRRRFAAVLRRTRIAKR